MFQKLFIPAILAGLTAGILISGFHHVTTVPLIIKAESYENKAETTNTGTPYQGARIYLAHGDAPGDHGEETGGWMPKDGLERTFWTTVTTILTATGFALLLTSCYALKGEAVTGRIGVIWGTAGFAAFALAPGLGLPPELPGSAAAALLDRQLWWLYAAIATASGLAAMIFGKNWLWAGLGLVLLISPHILGAPHPHEYNSPVPAEIGGHFATASLTASFILWTLLGWLTGSLYKRATD